MDAVALGQLRTEDVLCSTRRSNKKTKTSTQRASTPPVCVSIHVPHRSLQFYMIQNGGSSCNSEHGPKLKLQIEFYVASSQLWGSNLIKKALN